jgi:acyl-CoA reductase-like NAD-dependent aldehyde dehydrogenase
VEFAFCGYPRKLGGMSDHRTQPGAGPGSSREVEEALAAALNETQETAPEEQATARKLRAAAGQTRWRSRKQQLRARRLRRTSDELRAPSLDAFVEVGSLDELVEVLVLVPDGGHGNRSHDDGP